MKLDDLIIICTNPKTGLKDLYDTLEAMTDDEILSLQIQVRLLNDDPTNAPTYSREVNIEMVADNIEEWEEDGKAASPVVIAVRTRALLAELSRRDHDTGRPIRRQLRDIGYYHLQNLLNPKPRRR